MPLQNIEIVKIPEGFLRRPVYVCELSLAAGAAKSLAVPSVGGATAHFVVFSSDCDFRVGYDATASVPAGDVTDGTGCELNPTQRYVLGVSVLSLISPSGGRVTMSFYTS